MLHRVPSIVAPQSLVEERTQGTVAKQRIIVFPTTTTTYESSDDGGGDEKMTKDELYATRKVLVGAPRTSTVPQRTTKGLALVSIGMKIDQS